VTFFLCDIMKASIQLWREEYVVLILFYSVIYSCVVIYLFVVVVICHLFCMALFLLWPVKRNDYCVFNQL